MDSISEREVTLLEGVRFVPQSQSEPMGYSIYGDVCIEGIKGEIQKYIALLLNPPATPKLMEKYQVAIKGDLVLSYDGSRYFRLTRGKEVLVYDIDNWDEASWLFLNQVKLTEARQ